jgi:predicted dehydrogenase
MDRVVRDLGQGAPARSLSQILEDAETDVISIASYDQDHHAQVIAALERGKHVFCEKPLCRTSQELAEIQAAWGSSRLELASNLVLRAAPLYRWLIGEDAKARLGQIYAVDGDYLYGRLHKITEGWRRDVEDYSVMLGGGVHMVDLLLQIVRERPLSIRAEGNRIATAGTPFRYNDFVAATFRFGSGVVGRITANFGCVHRHHHVLRVFGTHATFIYDDQGPRLHHTREPLEKATPVELAPLPATKGDLIPDFIRRIQAGGDSRATQLEFDLMAACLAADRAAMTGQSISLE